MRRHLKKYFIPHEGNEFKPHFFRPNTIIFTAITLGALFLSLIVGSKYLVRSDFFAAIYPRALVSYANETRKGVPGEGELAVNATLEEAAKMKAEDMAKNGYFAHTSPDGKTPWYWLGQAGYVFKYAGENLAINFIDSEEVHKAWLASQFHRENILNPKFKEIGIATAIGTYQGKEAVFVVQFFGTPAVGRPTEKISTPVAPVAPPKTEVAAENQKISPIDRAGEPITIAIPGAEEKQVAGVYQENTASFLERFAVSPKTGLIWIYYIFFILVLSLILMAAFVELRRHHISIWVNGSVLLFITVALIVATMYFQSGTSLIL